MGEATEPGTKGYAAEAASLLQRYETIAPAEKHRRILHLLPAPPGQVLDIGAGSGADAAWFAALGHRVVAVEPVAELRIPAAALHPSPLIEWLDDSLPDLRATQALGLRHDVVMATAVWMHLDEAERGRAMPNVAALLGDGGILALTLRHGPCPPGRRMFEVTAEETVRLAGASGLRCVLDERMPSLQPANRRAGIEWSYLVFEPEEQS
ncbi:MAG: class I SAM-dependent methyltransferase [Proteobacteria bacterium]|nr:class I SAM-dependent methyltransferase [Pseudomonadota bacterium]